MSALPNDIAAATRDAIIERYENTAVRDALTGARDGSLTPGEGFFDLLADAKTIVDERGLMLAGDPRFSVSVAALVWSDPAVATPAVRLVDAEQSVDARLCCSRIELDLEDEVTSFELFYAPDVDMTPPPTGPAPRRIAPGGAGAKDGSSWENAAPLSALNSMIAQAALAGAEVWLRADAGVYNQTSVISLSRGGCTVRGVDVSGNPMMAEFVGNRASPWTKGAAAGSEMFRLNAGANNLVLQYMRFRNVGAGCIRMREPVSNILIEDIEAFNVGRGIVNYGNGTADATVTGCTVRRIKIVGFSKHGIQFRHKSTNILIADCDFDSGNIDGDFITCGVQLDDTASNGIVRRVSVRNVLNAGPGSYWNGDGFSGESGNANWRYEDCYAENISDGGIDHKGMGVVLVNFRTKYCKRSIRLWGDATVINAYSDTPRSRGGSGSGCHVFAMQGGKSRVRIQGGTFIQAGNAAIFRGDQSALIAWDSAAVAGIQAPSGYTLYTSEADDPTDSLSGVWNHADVTPPTITSNLALSLDENKPGTFRIAVSENATLEMRGPDVRQFNIKGRDLTVFAQDFEKTGGVAVDGSNILKIEIRALDVNGNYSAWSPLTVTINDVGDDPITVAQAIAATGATNGWWYDLSQPNTAWADLARTEPAIENGTVKAVTDLTGFGNHLTFPDGYEPLLRVVDGYRALEFTGAVVGNLGPIGGMRFAQFTSVSTIRRESTATDGTFVLLFSGRRSKNAASDNAMHRLNFLDTSTAQFRVNPQSGQTASSGSSVAPRGINMVVSHRSTDGILRTGYNANGMVQRLDGSDTGTATYPLADEQPLLGAAINETGAYINFFEGLWFAGTFLNAAFPDDIRFRTERQLGAAAGVPL